MNAWTTLGLKRTLDVAEIRRAYARKLKATDVEADPQAFIALRQALEWALAHARSRPKAAQPPPDTDADDGLDQSEAILANLNSAAARVEAAVEAASAADGDPAGVRVTIAETEAYRDEHTDDDGARFARLEALLFAGDEAAPDPVALAAAVREIADHPRMVQVEHDEAVQLWLADMLYAAIPRSDPVLALAIDRFGWEARADEVGQPWLFQALVERHRAFELIAQLADPSHRYHRAWRDLNRADERLGLKTIGLGDDVSKLLAMIRERCPPAEEMLAPHRVALWEEKFGRVGPARPVPWIMVGIWALIILSRVGSCATPVGPSATSAPPPITTTFNLELSEFPRDDIGPVLEPVLGRDGYSRLDDANPALHAQLIERWQDARDRRESRPDFQQSARRILNEAIGYSLRAGSDRMQYDYWRMHLERLKWLRDNPAAGGASACDQFATRSAHTVDFPNALDARHASVIARALLQPPATRLERREEGRYTIPGGLFEAARARSGLAETAFESSLLDGGTTTERCAARIALLETALELPPRRRGPFLRQLSRGL